MTTEIRTALIVDDEEQLLRLLARVLERAGYTTCSAESASEALRQFDERPADFDLAVLDVMMPGGGAATILPKLWEQRPDLRVILTSGDALPPELSALLATGIGQYLRKPFVPKNLLRMLSEGDGEDLLELGKDGRALRSGA